MSAPRPSTRRRKAPIVIRHAEPDDAPGVVRVITAREAARNTLQLPFRTVEDSRKYLAAIPTGNAQLVATVDGEIVGMAGLERMMRQARRMHAASLGLLVRDDWTGRGVGTALMAAIIDLADNWFALRRLELTVFPDNARAIALYERLGFVAEGLHRDYAVRDGIYVDALFMARLRAMPRTPD